MQILFVRTYSYASWAFHWCRAVSCCSAPQQTASTASSRFWYLVRNYNHNLSVGCTVDVHLRKQQTDARQFDWCCEPYLRKQGKIASCKRFVEINRVYSWRGSSDTPGKHALSCCFLSCSCLVLFLFIFASPCVRPCISSCFSSRLSFFVFPVFFVYILLSTLFLLQNQFLCEV